ncbi:hypothetical protein I6E38_09580 [Prevotella stercorea]|uniref:hypothetical protein n=1 Tax=Leyella stercorea TaxID=363265 RepID=UPI001F3511AB|nr:hypothetical protein [Leyella stercorea]MCF2579355.1 hypothetical protein [Leyella stercorea]
MKGKSYLLSFAKTKGSIAAVALAAVLMAANATVASAQNKATEDNGTEETVIGGVDDLSGVDPSSAICTSNGTAETDGDKIVCLYNIGAKKFLSVGGMWGTHASLDVTPYPIYMNLISGSEGTYRLESKVKGSINRAYLGIDTKHNQVFMDQGVVDRSVIRFVKANGYSETNKVYLVRIGNTSTLGYLTAYPNNEDKLCDSQANIATEGTPEYNNQEWKVITKTEYHELFNIAPANMKSVVDASFLIACPDFRANDADALKWVITGKDNKLPTDWESYMRFGDENMYKTHDKLQSTGPNSWKNYTEAHQRDYGQYFYCYTKGLRGFTFYQDVQVHKGGWYLLRCNGFSTSNSSENIKQNGKPLANLFITVLDANNNPIKEIYSTASLDGISQADAYQLAQTHNGKNYEGAGIGHAFFEGEYENQVQICLDKALDGNKISDKNPVTLRIGFYVDPTPDGKPDVADNELTAVDEFKLLYAGPRRNPELILDEESTDLLYLTEAADEYKNSVLHLNRKLNDNKWNSLILPVDLTWGQMKRTFGDAVKVAKLAKLTENSVQFVTVEPKNDDDVMVTAFEPYIVYPPYTQVKSAPYTVDRFYTSAGEDNSEWLGTDYKPSSKEDNRLTKTLKADHYDITMVSLDRDKLKNYVNTTNWESTTTFSATGGNHGTMTCKGTMAKTYDNGKIIEGRDDLNGDYFMYKGKLIQVPHGDMADGNPYSYGLKAFRCWFELAGNTSAEVKPSQVSLFIDGVADSTTGIDDIHGSTDRTSYKRGIEGVFNMYGQMVRRSCSLEGLPKGMYVVNGKKIIIR